MIEYIFIALGIIFGVLYFVARRAQQKPIVVEQKAKPEKVQKINYGLINIFYGTQTGTAAKLSQQFGEEAVQMGFEPEVVDLKDVNISHFEGKNRLSIFLLSNTGEGDPPENTIKWMQIIKGKQEIDEVKNMNWKDLNYTIFGLGNTQYEHYNETGIVVDRLLQKNGGNRVFRLGLGDDNCSLQDDLLEWKKQLWPVLQQYRLQHPLIGQIHEHQLNRKPSTEMQQGSKTVSSIQPVLANYRLFFKQKGEPLHVTNEDQLDFKTKVSLKAQESKVVGLRQLRQDLKDGSTLEFEIELPQHPEYQTAGNIALYSKNDPVIVREVMDYFNIKQTERDKKIGLAKINQDKKLKLNFVPNTIRSLLQQSIDLQGRLSKSVLKKLSKLQSNNPKYFIDNSSVKTTQEYKRITQKTDHIHWYYLIKIIKEYQVKISFQDFIQLSDSMAPRLFTIASHAKTQKNVVVAASIVDNGLISKFFMGKPKNIRVELRKSTFTDAMKWKKVIFIAAGTGLAPFRAYIQEKIYKIQQRKEGKEVNIPSITMYFGCKHENGDFIYKEEMMSWRSQGIIQKLHFAFSRDSQKKVYVQNLLQKDEAEMKELNQNNEAAIYICGSLPMGASIIQILTKAFGAEKVKKMQTDGRIVKELW